LFKVTFFFLTFMTTNVHFTSHEVLLPLLLPFHNLIFWFNLEYFALHVQDHGNNSKKIMCRWNKMHESLDTLFTKNDWLVHYICGLRSRATHFIKHIFKCHMVEAKQIFIYIMWLSQAIYISSLGVSLVCSPNVSDFFCSFVASYSQLFNISD
jgi:hypothetical protein